jgi:hypothetical protein
MLLTTDLILANESCDGNRIRHSVIETKTAFGSATLKLIADY